MVTLAYWRCQDCAKSPRDSGSHEIELALACETYVCVVSGTAGPFGASLDHESHSELFHTVGYWFQLGFTLTVLVLPSGSKKVYHAFWNLQEHTMKRPVHF